MKLRANEYYLVTGFNPSEFRIYNPNPALFKTHEEAEHMCEILKKEGMIPSFRAIRVGKFDMKNINRKKK